MNRKMKKDPADCDHVVREAHISLARSTHFSRQERRSSHTIHPMHPMQSRLNQVALFILLAGVSTVCSQDPSDSRIKKPRTAEDYQSRTLKEIAYLEPARDDMRDMRERMVTTKDFIPSKVNVAFTGMIRSIPPARKEVIRQWSRLYAGSIEHYTAQYQKEVLFTENGTRYWLAVPNGSELLKRSVKKGELLDLFLIRLGATTIGKKNDWVLLVENFQPSNRKQAVQITFRDLRFGKPPLINLWFDVLLRNDDESAKWFLFPGSLGTQHGGIEEKGGINALEVFAPTGKGKVIVGRFLGTGGFHAILLPAHAEVRLSRFPISYWGELPSMVPIEVVIAKSLTITGEDAATWFGRDPVSDVKAEISEDAEDVRRFLVFTKHSVDNKEVRPSIDVDRRVNLNVKLK